MKFKARIWKDVNLGVWHGHAFSLATGLQRAHFEGGTWEEAMSEAKRVLTGLNRRDSWDPGDRFLRRENPFCHPAHTGRKVGPGPDGKHVQGPGSWDGFYDPTEANTP